MKKLLLFLFWLGLAVPAGLQAEQLPSRTRGVSADSVYQVGDVDNINLFNGNLTLALPIGQTYLVSPQLSYRLALVYNSNVWDYEDGLSCLQNNQLRPYVFPFPVPSNNAGMGWSLHFGHLSAPNDPVYNKNNPSWLFVAPDGSQHNFYEKLHPTEPSTAGIFYSLDGAYLRLNVSNPLKATIESPEGLVRTFDLVDGKFRFSEMKDRFENWIRVTYTATSWEITDSQGRSHLLAFVADDTTIPQTTRFVRAELEAFGGGTATFSFNYAAASVERHRFHREPCDTDANHTEFAPVWLLTGVGQPDGTSYSFAYDTNDAGSTNFSGAIRSAVLATGGRTEWDYMTYVFQSQAPSFQESPKNRQRGIGARRTYLNATTGVVNGSWTYDHTPGYEVTPPSGPFIVSCWHRMRVSDHTQEQVTESYFATAGGPDNWWYGLPYAPCDPDTSSTLVAPWPAGNGTPFLSTRVYSKQGSVLTKVRSTYLIYDSDGRDAGDRQDRNSRLRYQKVVYHDDLAATNQPHSEETISADFDGLGHYRGMSRKSSFGPEKIVSTSYLPSGSYQLNPDTGATIVDTFTMPSLASAWIHGLSTGSSTTQGSAVSKRETCFDAATGFLLRQRLLAGGSQQAKDLVADFEQGEDAHGHGGFVIAERIFGSDDSANVPGGNLCSLSLDSPAIVKKTSYEFGGLTRGAWVEPCDENTEVLVTAEAEIDQSSGLPKTVIEANGMPVYLEYDVMGRLVAEIPEEGASRAHRYLVPANPNEDPSYEAQHCPQGTNFFCNEPERLSSRFWTYDRLGRMKSKALAYPGENGDAQPSVVFTLDGLGRKVEESTWGGAHKTVFGNFDVFGRARTITPEGSEATLLTFRGERIKAREVKVATSSSGLQSVFATEAHDHFGRLVAVCDGATAVWDGQGSCTGQLTRYTYDQDDRLIHVCQNVQPNNTCGQQRSFGWDGRGFLMSETHPEIGVFGNGTIDFQRDARGNPTSRDIRNDTGDRPLRYAYDPAGRPIKVEEQISSGWRVLKEFFYARENKPGSSERRRGQLVMAKRTNWVTVLNPLPLIEGGVPLVVTDHYEYFGLGGRPSKKTTSISLPSGSQSWSTFFAYDTLGEIASITYPSGDWPYQSAPARQVAFNRRLGFLTSIPGYASSITYQLGGMLYEIDYANNVRWRQTAEAATGWERPDNIETLNAASNVLWSTGDYSYDGVGNISRIGNRGYTYDSFSRFKSAMVDGQSLAEQAAAYDAYGNLIALARGSNTRFLTANATTNRLTIPEAVYTSNGELARAQIEGVTFEYGYDGLGQQLFQQTNSNKTWVYAYDASDERVLSWECALDRCGTGTNKERYTLRGLGGEVLRVFEGPNRASLAWKEDFVYRNGQALAWIKSDPAGEKRLYLHGDHLGSTRQITDAAGLQVSRHDFLPYGEESTATTSGDVALKFTGHERDQPGKPVDYMNARFCSPLLARFLRTDPVMQIKRALMMPQQWNRFAYALNNPLKYTDPSGKDVSIMLNFSGEGWTDETKEKIIEGVASWYRSQNVGKVFIFDGAKGSHGGNFFERIGNRGYTSIEVSSSASTKHIPTTVFAGSYNDLPPQQRITAISNAIVHETVAHHFGATLGHELDQLYYVRGSKFATSGFVERYGTVADSYAYTESTRKNVTDGPIPILLEDQEKLQSVLRHEQVEPPNNEN